MTSPPELSPELQEQAIALLNRAGSKKSEMKSKENKYDDAWRRYITIRTTLEDFYQDDGYSIGFKDRGEILFKAMGSDPSFSNLVLYKMLQNTVEEFIADYTEESRREMERAEPGMDNYVTQLESAVRELASTHKDYIRSARDYYALLFQASHVLLDALKRQEDER